MEKDLLAMLEPLFPRLAWGQVPTGTPRPYLTLSRISGLRGYVDAGPDGFLEARVQAVCYADSYLVATAERARVIATLSGRRAGRVLGVMVESDRDLPPFDAEGQPTLFRTSVDLLISYNEG